MATSGSFDYSVTADDIITAALEDIKVAQAGEDILSDNYAVALRTLNLLVKQWSAMSDFAPGLKIFARKRVRLFLDKGVHQYLIGPAATDARAATSYGITTLSAAEAAAQTTLSITSNTDTTSFPGSTITMADNDIVGIELDDGTIHWTVISGTPSTTMDVDTGLASGAASGNKVYWFTSRAQRLEYVEAAVIRNSNNIDSPLGVYRTVKDYEENVGDKFADGAPSNILVESLRINTRITLDSQPTDVTDNIILTGFYPMEDYDNASGTDDIAYPAVWYAALEWELAKRCASKWTRRWTNEMEQNRKDAILLAQNQNPENSSVYAMRDD